MEEFNKQQKRINMLFDFVVTIGIIFGIIAISGLIFYNFVVYIGTL